MDLEKKIAELGHVVLGGGVVLALDSEMILDRCIERVADVKDALQDATIDADAARMIAAEALGIELGD